MISVSEQTHIPSPAAVVWPLLSDPETVVSCIPGAELSPNSADGLWRGSIKIKFGPTIATFRGEATLKFDDDTRTCTVDGRGIDSRGASRALANGKIVVSGETETTLDVDGEFHVTGPIEGFVNAGGVHVTRALIEEFAKNLTNLVATQSATPDATPGSGQSSPVAQAGANEQSSAPASPTPAAELNAFSLLGKIIRSWLSGLFGNNKG